MSSVVAGITDGVRGLLQTRSDAGSFIRTFTPERAYSITVKLEDIETLHVHVLHGVVEVTVDSRGQVRYRVPVRIAVRKKFDASDLNPATGFAATQEVDELAELTEQICEYMPKREITLASGKVSCLSANILTLAPEDEFETNQQFLGVVEAEFVHFKTIT